MALDVITLSIILLIAFITAYEMSKIVYHSVADLASLITAMLVTYILYTLLA
jgi:hypothetical protein